jgi:hypothetical protein
MNENLPRRSRVARDALLLLAQDVGDTVRAALADTLADMPDAPRELVLALARDAVLQVCEPLIRLSAVLREADLLDLVAHPPHHHTRPAVARRLHVAAPVAEALIRAGEPAAILALLRNGTAHLTPAASPACRAGRRLPWLRSRYPPTRLPGSSGPAWSAASAATCWPASPAAAPQPPSSTPSPHPIPATSQSSSGAPPTPEGRHGSFTNLQHADRLPPLSPRRSPATETQVNRRALCRRRRDLPFAPPVRLAQQATITGAGATFPRPLYERWSQAAKEPVGIQLNYQSIGSGGGINQITARTVDFGASDAPADREQLTERKLLQFPSVLARWCSAPTCPAWRTTRSS